MQGESNNGDADWEHSMKKVIIIGAGGHAKVCADIVLKSGDELVGFMDEINPTGSFLGYNKIGSIQEWTRYKNCEFLISIGNARERMRIAETLNEAKWYTAIHPSAVISGLDIEIEAGTMIMANAVVNAGTCIGKHCIINSGSIVEHDNIIEDYVHLSVGTKTGGHVHIGKKTWVGMGATIIDNIKIVDEVLIGAGAVVVKNINTCGTYIGIPAKKIETVVE